MFVDAQSSTLIQDHSSVLIMYMTHSNEYFIVLPGTAPIFYIFSTSATYIFDAVTFRRRIIRYAYKYAGKYTYSVSDGVLKCVHMRRF
jgi:hypothetical protein